MALIKCTECDKEISDKAPACIHCGCPMAEITRLPNIDIQDLLNNNGRDKEKMISLLINEYHYSKMHANSLVSVALDDQGYHTDVVQYDEKPENIAKCPTCSSTNIRPLGTATRLASTSVLGLASGSIGKTFECKNCGYKW